MFDNLCKTLSKVDTSFKAFYVIHDALVCQVSTSLRNELEDISKVINMEGVGPYETKMTSINDN